MEFLRDTQIDFMKYRKVFVVLSLVLLVVSVMAVFVHGKLNVGVDFAGGTQLTLRFQERPEIDELRAVLARAGIEDAQIQRFGEADANEVMVRTSLPEGDAEADVSQSRVTDTLDAHFDSGGAATLDLNRAGGETLTTLLVRLDPEGLAASGAAGAAGYYGGIADAIIDMRQEDGLFTSWDEVRSTEGVSPAVAAALESNSRLGTYALLAAENVGPQIGKELRFKGVLAVVLSLLGMGLYIWLRFELRFGVGALIASLHDVMVVLGLYALMDYEFNLTTVAAFLTLVGYSVNDTVVIFDRVRENMRRSRRLPFVEIINVSVNQTLTRTILTSGTTLLAVGALFVLGGDVLRGFSFVLAVGIVVGTYSSLYVASPFAILWEQVFGGEARAKKAPAKAA